MTVGRAYTARVAALDGLDAAGAADRAVTGMSDDLLARNEAMGGFINSLRSEHRQEHLDDLEGVF